MGVMEWEPRECICEEKWRRNQIYVMGLTRWWCPLHAIVTPDKDGNRVHTAEIDARKQPRRLQRPHPDGRVKVAQLKLLAD